jgi:hypothetical protein
VSVVTVGFICHGQQTGTKEKGIVIHSISFQNDQVGYPSRNFLAGIIGEGDTMPFSLQSWVLTKSIGVTIVRVQFKDGHPNILCPTCSPKQPRLSNGPIGRMRCLYVRIKPNSCPSFSCMLWLSSWIRSKGEPSRTAAELQ